MANNFAAAIVNVSVQEIFSKTWHKSNSRTKRQVA